MNPNPNEKPVIFESGDGTLEDAQRRLREVSAVPDMAMREAWPGQFEHWKHHDLMVEEHARTGVYRDPVSGKVFPKGQAMLRDPGREQRRRLKRWRATGRAK